MAFWTWITRLGEAQLLLPLMLLAVLWLLLQRQPARTALGWLAATVLAAAITTVSKVAFIGYGWGLPALDFTGFSGHAMFAAAVWPPLLRLAAAAWWPARPGVGWLAGYALAVLVAVSRVQVGAHSWSEVLAGLALGAAASGVVLARGHWPRLALTRLAPLALGAVLALGVARAPASRTHDWVTRLALASSGRTEPFQRWAPQSGPATPKAGGAPARRAPASLQPR
ncbi:phosphatase PAP2 family protein [Aquabacterium sp. OR-4]|uniref:phosphatase PAP2 family protein n=1 Tax=Aquabacterium sp. OR-4 TaxID=2978127 RepID=UPI0021B37AAE|nr:phosphatase PAP2 family protein [Aquabacterium sp. OR-4]MDT7833895.1 phosphatase PAP2 family protein [Aquabacterium sp. OR-4]